MGRIENDESNNSCIAAYDVCIEPLIHRLMAGIMKYAAEMGSGAKFHTDWFRNSEVDR
jgi:hypothetical protein